MSIIIYLFSLFIYLLSLAPSVYWGDSGELTGVCYTLGVAHSTGYPLYTILGKIFTFIPLSSVAVRCNFFSSFFASLSSVFLFWTLNIFLKNKRFSSFITSLLFSFSFSFWEHSLISEVHALNIFLIIFLVFTLLKKDIKFLYLSFFLLGVCFTNHNTILPLLPAFLFLKRGEIKFKNIFLFIFLFSLPFSLYLSLPLRAAKLPLFNFANPFNLERFFWLTTGKGASLAFNLNLQEILLQIKTFIKNIFPQFNIFFIFSFIGIFSLYKNEREKFYFLLLFFFFPFIYAINLKIPDILPYFLPVFLSIYFFLFSGLSKFTPSSIILIFPLILILQNYPQVCKNKVYSPYIISYETLKSLPKNSVIITPDNNLAFPLWYLQRVENFEPSAVVIYRKLLPFRWYQEQLKNSFLNIPEKLENSEKFSEKLSKEICQKIYLSNKKIKFYCTHYEREIFDDNFLIPSKTVFKVAEKSNKISYVPLINFPDSFEERTKNVLSLLLLERAKAYLELNKLSFSILELKKGIKINPKLSYFYNNLGYIYQIKGDLKLAEENYKKSLGINPSLSSTYSNLGVVYLLQNKINLAEDAYLKCLSLDKLDATALNNLYEIGIIYFRKRDLKSAEKIFKEIRNYNNSPSLCYALGITYYKMGKLELAKIELENYLEKGGKELRGKVKKLLRTLEKK